MKSQFSLDGISLSRNKFESTKQIDLMNLIRRKHQVYSGIRSEYGVYRAAGT